MTKKSGRGEISLTIASKNSKHQNKLNQGDEIWGKVKINKKRNLKV